MDVAKEIVTNSPKVKCPRSRTLYEVLLEVAVRCPEHEAVVSSSGTRLTYSELVSAAAGVAYSLQELGVARGDTVALLANNRIEWLEAYLGAAAVGASVAAFDTWSNRHELEFLIDHSGAKVLITIDRLGSQDFLAHVSNLVPEAWEERAGTWKSGAYPRLTGLMVIGGDPPLGGHSFHECQVRAARQIRGDARQKSDARPNDTAIIMYTSGSTGRPKVVPLLHSALIENGFNIGRRQQLSAEDRVWLPVPLFWSYGGANALMASLTHGATLVLQETFDASQALALIRRERCTVAYTLPNITRALLDEPHFSHSMTRSLRKGMTIGHANDIRLAAQELGAFDICNIYGSTELYGTCCVTPSDWPLDLRAESQGLPLPGVKLRIADAQTGRSLPPGETGEILVAGYVTPGYIRSDPQLRSRFLEDGYFRTGDLGYLDDDGSIHFVSRMTEVIKASGINVSPKEIEEFLLTHPFVAEAAVVGVPHPIRGERAIAFIRTISDRTETISDELWKYCRASLAAYKVPDVIVPLAELPLTRTGKISKKKLQIMAQQVLFGNGSSGS